MMSDNVAGSGSADPKLHSDVPTIPLHRLRIFNPSSMTGQEIEGLFAVREEILQRILEDICRETPYSRPQHHLLVGQRGMGKTTMLLRLAAALRQSPLHQHFIPLSFAEEQYTIDRLSQFWLNCLDSLAVSCDLAGLSEQAIVIDKVIRDIADAEYSTPKDDTAAARATLDAFLHAASLTGRRPVLLVDNLQLIFERTALQQSELRAALTEPNAPVVIAAAPHLPRQITDYSFPLFDHFKIHHLKALSLDEMRRLLLRLAVRTSRPAIRQHILANPGRLRALHQLTGGNPRTTVLLFHLYAEDCSPAVAEDLEKLLDIVTVVYKQVIEALSPQQQALVAQMAQRWDPVDSRTLTENQRLEPGQVSSQIDRLVKAGVVEEVELYGTSRTGYQLAERFFNVWYLMRNPSRRFKQPLLFLTKFLETLYEPDERENVARSWTQTRGLSSSSLLFSRALADCIPNSHVRGDLIRNTELEALQLRAAKNIHRLLDLDHVSPRILEFADLRGVLESKFGESPARQILSSLSLLLSARRPFLAAIDQPSPEQIKAVLEEINASESSLISSHGKDAVDWLANRLFTGQLCHQDSVDDWERTLEAAVAAGEACVKLVVDYLPESLARFLHPQTLNTAADLLQQSQPQTAGEWFALGWRLHVKLQKYEAAESAYQKATVLDKTFAWPWNGLGNLLMNHTRRYKDAEAACLQAISLDPHDAWPWNNLGNLHMNYLQRYEEAETAFRKAIERDQHYALPWNGLGRLLMDRLQRYEEAELAFRKAIELDRDFAWPWNNLGNLLQHHLERYEEAETAYRKSIELDPHDAWPWNGLGNLYCDHFGRYADAEAAFSKAEESPDSRVSALLNHVFLQRDFLGNLAAARQKFDAVDPQFFEDFADTKELHFALFAAYELNLGMAAAHLDAALDQIPNGLPAVTADDWARTAAVLLELGHGAWFQQVLQRRGHNHSLRPFFESIRAHTIGDRAALLNVAPEVRQAAGWLFDQIQTRRRRLQDARRRQESPQPRRPARHRKSKK